jgi:predicted CoA-binding protein
MKKTLVLGASPNPTRYSFTAVRTLKSQGHTAIPVGIKEGNIAGIEIEKGQPDHEGVHTITLYLNPKRQQQYYDYILSLRPKRIIFNPGTENPELMQIARDNGIEVEVACTLVMLAIGDY